MPLQLALGRLARSAWRYVRRAPGTFIWLAILFVTTLIIRHVSPHFAHHILVRQSTNIKYLHKSPVRVLITSALWIAGSGWFVYFLLYNVFHVPAERWLGTARWLAVAFIAHVCATYLSECVLLWAIDTGRAPERARHTLDYGVSYALAGVQGVLTYLIATPWRYLYLLILLGFYGSALISEQTFTEIGHLSAVLFGLACYPLTLGRPTDAVGGPFDPVATARRLWRRRPGGNG
jgi:hypothetical protein